MSAAATLERCRVDGVEIWAEGERLRYRGTTPLSDALLSDLRAHKVELLALLAANQAPASDLAEDFEERAAIVEEGDKTTRHEAERKAFVLVYCRACLHWRADRINQANGMGTCMIGAEPLSQSPQSFTNSATQDAPTMVTTTPGKVILDSRPASPPFTSKAWAAPATIKVAAKT